MTSRTDPAGHPTAGDAAVDGWGRGLRIAHVLPILSKGGGERVALDLANHAAGAGHEVTLILGAASDPAVLPTAIDPRIRIRYVSAGPASRLGRYAAALPWLRRHRGWLKSQDVIHSHLTFGSALGSLAKQLTRWGKGGRPAIVETYHAVGMPMARTSRALHALLARRRDGFALMALDAFWSRFAAGRGSAPTQVIPNGVDFAGLVPPTPAEVERYRSAVAHIPDDARLVIGSVGRLAPERRPAHYIPVFARIAAALGPSTHFLLAGDGPEREKVEKAVADHALGTLVHLPGLIARPALAMAAMDLYITVNVGSVTGIAALEAAYLGRPVIAIQLLADHQRGAEDWIWSSADPEEVAAEAIRLLRDPAARARLAARQSAHVRTRHSVDGMAAAYYGLYRDAIARVRPELAVPAAADADVAPAGRSFGDATG